MLDKDHTVYIVTDFPFPYGFAGTSRIISYAKGLIFNGSNSIIICIRKTESPNNVLNENVNGVFDGIDYKYLSKSTIKSRYLVKRRVDNYLMALRLFLYSLTHIRKQSTVIYYSPLTHTAILLKLASLVKGFKLLKEENEHPSVRTKLMKNVQAYVYNNYHYKLFDGVLVITKKLNDYFKNIYPEKPILHIPMLVDLDRFNLKVEKTNSIIYSGMLSDGKDGVGNLIYSFAEIAQEFPDYKLIIIGIPYYNEELIHFKKIIEDLGIKKKVVFLGRVPNDKIPAEISKAAVLVLPRPDSIQAQNGFPTKLGEYLATGNPVVVTKVGEIPDYLTDKENAYLADPGSIENLTSKLRELFGNLGQAESIGKEGRKTAEVCFDNKKQTKRILSFINDLKSF